MSMRANCPNCGVNLEKSWQEKRKAFNQLYGKQLKSHRFWSQVMFFIVGTLGAYTLMATVFIMHTYFFTHDWEFFAGHFPKVMTEWTAWVMVISSGISISSHFGHPEKEKKLWGQFLESHRLSA